MTPMNKFIFRDLRRVKGYLDPADALVFLSILQGQEQKKYSGSMAEIGIYYGRSFFLLRKMARLAERVLGIDLFNIGETKDGMPAQMHEFLENGKKIGLPVERDQIIIGDSTKLTADDVLNRVGPVRFFSVDGGHALHHVQADSRLARDSLAEFGVIAFDDSFNPEWPEVTVAIIDFLRGNAEKYSAFCVTNKKTYICNQAYFDFYKDLILRSPHLKVFKVAEVMVLGTCAVRVHHPIERRIIYEILVRSGAGALAGWIY